MILPENIIALLSSKYFLSRENIIALLSSEYFLPPENINELLMKKYKLPMENEDAPQIEYRKDVPQEVIDINNFFLSNLDLNKIKGDIRIRMESDECYDDLFYLYSLSGLNLYFDNENYNTINNDGYTTP
jgi:hypothetical protein